MSGETTLLPCPFCGGEAELVEGDYGMFMTGYAVYCKQCCTKVGVTGRLGEAYEWTPIYDTEAEAIAAWNTRAELGGGTCEITATVTNNLMYPDYMTKWYELSCGHSLNIKGDEAPKWCAVCGKEVTR